MTAAAVRPGGPHDAAALLAVSLAAIRVSAVGHYTARELEAWAERRTLDDLALTLRERVVRVAERDGRPVGFASLDGDTGRVGQLLRKSLG